MNELVQKEAANLIRQFAEEGSVALAIFYQKHRNDFLSFGKKYGLPEEELLDIYQDAIIVFYENVKNRKLTVFTSSPKTYLFAIAKNLMFNRFKQLKRSVATEDIDLTTLKMVDFFDAQADLNHRQQLFRRALSSLGLKCKTLLMLFYYRNYSIESIMNKMEYGSDNVVKATKSRCLKQLRTILEKLEI